MGLVDYKKIEAKMKKVDDLYHQLPKQCQTEYKDWVEELRKTSIFVVATQNVLEGNRFLSDAKELSSELSSELSKVLNDHVDEAKKQYDIFLSYSALDDVQASKVAETLTRQGLKVFIATHGIDPGENWAEKLISVLQNSKALSILATPNSLDSRWVSIEIGMALAYKLKIIPILHQRVEKDLPEILRRHQAIHFDELSKITNVLGNL